ncbi:unnamed protein product, partial [Iphiclides podalirius]
MFQLFQNKLGFITQTVEEQRLLSCELTDTSEEVPRLQRTSKPIPLRFKVVDRCRSTCGSTRTVLLSSSGLKKDETVMTKWLSSQIRFEPAYGGIGRQPPSGRNGLDAAVGTQPEPDTAVHSAGTRQRGRRSIPGNRLFDASRHTTRVSRLVTKPMQTRNSESE